MKKLAQFEMLGDSSEIPLKIWIVSLFESTPMDNTRPMRFAGIADAAAHRGHHITHFSCTFRHSTKHQRFAANREIRINDNLDLVFIYAESYRKNLSFKRIASHRMFTRNLMTFISNREKPDVILVTMPPLSSGVALAKWGKRNNIPIVLDIIDPWPDVFLRLVPSTFRPILRILLSPMYRQLKTILSNITAVISISKEYIEWAKSFNSTFSFTGAFYPAVKFKEVQSMLATARRELQVTSSDKLTIIYAGNLASSYDIPTILRASILLEESFPGETEFVICGVGPQAKLIEEHARQQTNVRYLGRIGHGDLMKQYAFADLGLTQHIRGATQSVTYKFFDYLGAGLPILNSLQSEMSSLIAENSLGLNNKPGDAVELANNIAFFIRHPAQLESFKQNALDFTRSFGDADVTYRKLVQMLENVVEFHKPVSTENVSTSL